MTPLTRSGIAVVATPARAAACAATILVSYVVMATIGLEDLELGVSLVVVGSVLPIAFLANSSQSELFHDLIAIRGCVRPAQWLALRVNGAIFASYIVLLTPIWIVVGRSDAINGLGLAGLVVAVACASTVTGWFIGMFRRPTGRFYAFVAASAFAGVIARFDIGPTSAGDWFAWHPLVAAGHAASSLLARDCFAVVTVISSLTVAALALVASWAPRRVRWLRFAVLGVAIISIVAASQKAAREDLIPEVTYDPLSISLVEATTGASISPRDVLEAGATITLRVSPLFPPVQSGPTEVRFSGILLDVEPERIIVDDWSAVPIAIRVTPVVTTTLRQAEHLLVYEVPAISLVGQYPLTSSDTAAQGILLSGMLTAFAPLILFFVARRNGLIAGLS